mgnify:CR=1 FL=1
MVERLAKSLTVIIYLVVIVNPFKDLDYDKINVYSFEEDEIEFSENIKGGDQDLRSKVLDDLFNYLYYLGNDEKDD